MQRYSVKCRTVRYDLHGTIRLEFTVSQACVCAFKTAGPPPQVNVQSPPLTHSDQPITLWPVGCSSWRKMKENKQAWLAVAEKLRERTVWRSTTFIQIVCVGAFWFCCWIHQRGSENRNFTVCKRCLRHVPYSNGNTSNMGKHLKRTHPDITLSEHRTVERPGKVTAAKQQRSIENAFQQTYHATSDKYKKITRAVGAFIAKDLQPFSVQRRHSRPLWQSAQRHWKRFGSNTKPSTDYR